MRKQKVNQDFPEAEEAVTGEVITAPTEYTLKKTITYRGESKGPGAIVKLNTRQAERLKESGHI